MTEEPGDILLTLNRPTAEAVQWAVGLAMRTIGDSPSETRWVLLRAVRNALSEALREVPPVPEKAVGSFDTSRHF